MFSARPSSWLGAGLRLLLFAVFTMSAGCTRQSHIRPLVGPDGTPMFHVSCGGDQGACFELAGRSCPQGYALVPLFDRRDNNFLVRCRTGGGNPLAWSAPTPSDASFSLRTSPAAGSGNVARSSVVTNPADPNEIDLGY
jgi:hypothetical protein